MTDAPKPDETPADTEKPETPQWGDDFNAERAWRLVQNLRGEVAGLKTERDDARTEAASFKAAAEKTGTERDEALADALKRAEAAERVLAIKEHNLPDDVVEEFADYLTGTPDEVKAKAAKLAARLAPPKVDEKPEDETPSDEKPDETPEPEIPGRPRPRLVPGNSSGDDATPFDPKAIAEKARRGY